MAAKRTETSDEETEILASYERDEWRSVGNLKEEISRYREYAAGIAATSRKVEVLLSLSDLERVRRKAVEVGIPYQTLIADIVHSYVTERSTEPYPVS